eukprot:645239-Alexandrium_andersonii.AAC.1
MLRAGMRRPSQHTSSSITASPRNCSTSASTIASGAIRVWMGHRSRARAVSYTHLRAHETSAHL